MPTRDEPRLMRVHLPLRHVAAAAFSLAVVGAMAAAPGAIGSKIRSGVAGIGEADPTWLWAGGAAAVATALLGALALRAGLTACGCRLPALDAAARYCVGNGVNAVAPFQAGTAVRLALLGRRVDGGVWRVGGAAAAVASVRGVWLATLIAAGAVAGPLPAWPIALLAAGLTLAAVAAKLAGRLRLPARLARVLDPFVELGRQPRALALVACWTLAGVVAKVVTAAAVMQAFGIARPLEAALLVAAAVELAAILPLTPGNVGVAAAAAAFALGAHGVDADAALAAGIALGAVEWLASIAVGLGGGLALAGPRIRPHLRMAAVSASLIALTWAFGATVLLPAV